MGLSRGPELTPTASETSFRDEVICVCYRITGAEILGAINEGAKSLEDLQHKTRVATRCMGCEVFVEELLAEFAPMADGSRQGLRRWIRRHGTWRVVEAVRKFRWDLRKWWDPTRLATWVSEEPRMHTRLVMANLGLPDQPARDAYFSYELRDEEGTRVHKGRTRIRPNQLWIAEIAAMLREAGIRTPWAGLFFLELPQVLGSRRFYVHWYNDVSLTSTHEKYPVSRRKHEGYWTLSKVVADDRFETHIALANMDHRPYVTHMVLMTLDGQVRGSTRVTLPPLGSVFKGVRDFFCKQEPNFRDDLVLYLDNPIQPIMFYYFVLDRERGAWQGQHL